MYHDEFKLRYTSIPFATFSRNHKKGEEKKDLITFAHMHREIEILVVLDGNAKIDIDNISYDIKKGDIVIVPPYAVHSTTIFRDYDFKHFCICFDAELIGNEAIKQNVEKGCLVMNFIIEKHETNNSVLRQCLNFAYKAHDKKTNGWELEVKGFLCAFFGILFKNGYIKKGVMKKNDINYKIMDLTEKNYREKLNSKKMAEALFVSETYFCRIFKKNFGHCFQNYLCMYRIEKAKILLKTTEAPVSQIAFDTGFNSFAYFGKMFKKYVGETPSQYRKS